jgi:hypothetical protein
MCAYKRFSLAEWFLTFCLKCLIMRKIEELTDRLRGYDSHKLYSGRKSSYFSRSLRGSLGDELFSEDMITFYVSAAIVFAILGFAIDYFG